MPQILKKRRSFTLRRFLDLGNTSLEQNLGLKTLDYLLFIPAIYFIYLVAPWLTFGYYWVNSLTHVMLIIAFALSIFGTKVTRKGWISGFPGGFDCNDIIHLPTHPKLQKKLSPDLHPIFPKCGNASNIQKVMGWHCSGLQTWIIPDWM